MQKGPGNGRNQYQPLVSTNIVASGFVTAVGAGAGNNVTVTLSGGLAMDAPAANLIVVAVPQATAAVSALVASKTDTTTAGVTTMTSFVITPGGAGLIAWMVVKP
jgi:hypothetical protein